MIRFIFLALMMAGLLRAEPIDLRLPTENQHLFSGEPEQFFMYVDLNFEGHVNRAWEGGSFGFVREARRINGDVVMTRFHEGIDIAPMKRDNSGNPMDLVSSIAAGRVVHISPVAGQSNYGKYIVVEHSWEGSQVVSLYAHLAEILVKPGDAVSPGTVLGRMGFTGVGIDKTRAHCHVELGMVMSTRYDDWHKKNGGGTNFHGIYNGMNITGCEVSRFFLEQKANPDLQFSQFITATPAYFKVAVPAAGTPDFVTRYPWIARGTPDSSTKSWEISFTATGLPVTFAPSPREVVAPTIVSIRPATVPHRYLTRGLVSGDGTHATLSNSGKQLVALLTNDFPAAPTPAHPPHP
ncbi:MAG: M23 family metallopeptidase [Luteolibacter sp.]|uniref:M23 family metallopeptidase n=1 Tax=Luteolibacter sp. TaxID=1962973 RepID=UPI00326643F0